jgi:hypothetical protein
MNSITQHTIHPSGDLGVDMSFITSYDFEDNGVMDPASDIYDKYVNFLGRRCVAIGDRFYVKDAGTGRWSKMTKPSARSTLYAQHGGAKTNLGITTGKIDDFSNKHVPVFAAPIFAPGAPEFVIYGGSKRLNTWTDLRRPGNLSCFNDAEIIMRLIRENLCDEEPKGFAEMFEEIERGKRTKFNYVMHWLASAYVNIGHHIGTALWFVGPNQGVGKGTLLKIMRHLIGAGQVAGVNVKEFETWNSFLNEAVLVEGDEVSFGSRKELAAVMKMMIGNPTITIRERNVGSYGIPNVANWIMTTNDLAPILLDPGDRRHTMIQTTSDRSRNGLAIKFNTMPRADRENCIAGFAAILQSISIDTRWISKPFETDLKRSIIDESRDPVERWFATTWSVDFMWRIGKVQSSHDLFRNFLEWKKDNEPNCYISTKTAFGRGLRKLESQAYVAQNPDTRARGWIKVRNWSSVGHEIEGDNVVDIGSRLAA